MLKTKVLQVKSRFVFHHDEYKAVIRFYNTIRKADLDGFSKQLGVLMASPAYFSQHLNHHLNNGLVIIDAIKWEFDATKEADELSHLFAIKLLINAAQRKIQKYNSPEQVERRRKLREDTTRKIRKQ